MISTNINASEGWHRYDIYFTMPVKGSEEEGVHYNEYRATGGKKH